MVWSFTNDFHNLTTSVPTNGFCEWASQWERRLWDMRHTEATACSGSAPSTRHLWLVLCFLLLCSELCGLLLVVDVAAQLHYVVMENGRSPHDPLPASPREGQLRERRPLYNRVRQVPGSSESQGRPPRTRVATGWTGMVVQGVHDFPQQHVHSAHFPCAQGVCSPPGFAGYERAAKHYIREVAGQGGHIWHARKHCMSGRRR